MSDNTTADTLGQLRAMVADAKSVPMSASCMVNRAEALRLIEVASASLESELAEANRVITESRREVDRGRDEGDRIRGEAEEWAEKTAAQTEIVTRANRQAGEILAKANDDAEGLRRETDQYVDTRMAEFEANLQRTASQVRTMRARLALRNAPAEQTDDDAPTVVPHGS